MVELETEKEQKTTTSHVGRHGELRLGFRYHEGQTRLSESFFRTPLQVMRAIPDSANCLCVYMLSPSGGIVQGDQYNIRIRLEAGSHALITSIAANKVYRMPHAFAQQSVEIEVEAGAILEYLPDALILFKDADLRQTLKVKLHEGAICILQEAVMGGRLARDEVLQFRRFKNQIQVEDARGLLLLDSTDFQPQPDDLQRIGLLDNFPIWATWYLLGDLEAWGIDAGAFCQQFQEFSSPNGIASISTLYRNGLSARILANRLEHIEQYFEPLRMQFRQIIQRPYTRLRK
jgi:urease accessory protein